MKYLLFSSCQSSLPDSSFVTGKVKDIKLKPQRNLTLYGKILFFNPISKKSFSLTHSHTNLTFNDLEKDAFQKTLWKEEKMLVTSIFSFSHNVFNPFQNKFHFSQLFCYLQMLSIWTSLKFCRLVKS